LKNTATITPTKIDNGNTNSTLRFFITLSQPLLETGTIKILMPKSDANYLNSGGGQTAFIDDFNGPPFKITASYTIAGSPTETPIPAANADYLSNSV